MSTFYRQIKCMGTRLEFVIPEIEESAGLSLVRDIGAELELLENEISNYRPDSGISRVNRDGFYNNIKVSDHVEELVREGLIYSERTMGCFDMTLGGWTSKPDLIRDTGLKFRNLQEIPIHDRIRMSGNSIRLLNENVRIDTGGIGKGFAMRLIEKSIRGAGISRAFISFGGSSVMGLGNHPHGELWKVGIRHPEDNERVIGEVELRDQTVSISGNSLNNRKKFGEEGHILDPVSGAFYTAEDIVTVKGTDPLDCEVLSTAFLIAGTNTREKLNEEFPELEFNIIESE